MRSRALRSHTELAVDGQAQMLVTGDKDLLELSPYRNIQILTPAAALAVPDAALLTGSANVP
jgi:predicted nucleic acid-binding protein